MASRLPPPRRKQFLIDRGVLTAMEALARDSGLTLDQLANQSFRALLAKHRRPVTLQDALRASVRTLPANDQGQTRIRGKARRKG